jgi:hypothetical protein
MVVIARDTKLPIARAAAIDAHANFEQALFTLFASLLGAPRDRAGIVFFRIASAPTRNKILESLLKKTHGNKYKVYWNGSEPKAQDGLFPLIRQIRPPTKRACSLAHCNGDSCGRWLCYLS